MTALSYTDHNQKTGRTVLPDLVRAFALIGIAVVNVAYLAYPMGDYNAGPGLVTNLDDSLFFGVNALFLMKSYTLFSFMFGVGFAFQITSAERKNATFSPRYWRRIVGLLVLGLLHVLFIFQGDILFLYGIIGALLFLFRKTSPKALKRWAIGFYMVQIIILGLAALGMWAGETFDPEGMKDVFSEFEVAEQAAMVAFSDGSFIQAMSQRFVEWTEYVIFGTILQGFGIIAFFLFGLSAVRSGIISDPSAAIWKTFRRIYLPIGIIGSCIGAWFIMGSNDGRDATMMIGMFFIGLSAPFSTAGYLGLIAKWANGPMTKFKTFLARGGTATLTAYLMQGLLMSLIFNNYGLGLFAEIGATACIAIAFTVAIFTVAFASLWRTRFERGPMEFLLRRWTYLGRS